jgi:4-alpha-glucanotransferase
MNALELVLGFDISHPPGMPRSTLKRAWEQAYSPLLRELEERTTAVVSLRMSGVVLDFLENEHPEGIDLLRRLVERGQVEIVGGAYYDAVLSALPERDAVGQLRLCARRWKHLVGAEPTGACLAYGAWDPSLPRVLARGGLRYVVMDASALQLAGVDSDSIDGHYMTEREGATVAVFPNYCGEDPVNPGMEPARVLGLLRRYSMRQRRNVVWMLDARELGVRPGSAELCWGRAGGWLPRLLGRFASQDHWLKLASFSSLLQRYRSSGRVYLPATMDPTLQAAATIPPHTRCQRPGTAARLSKRDDRRAPPTLPWEAFLGRYEEANRLHKRMLVTSREVARLASHVRAAGRRPGASSLARGLERALLWLYQAQAAAAYTHDPWGGMHVGRLRHRAYAALLRAEQQVRRMMGESGRLILERIDTDCDGREELVVTTPYLRGVLDPARGGALTQLDLLEVGANVLNTLTRRCERVHAVIDAGDDLPSLVASSAVSAAGVAAVFTSVAHSQPDDEITEETPLEADLSPAIRARQLAVDAHTRATFVDHFLDPQASLHNLHRGQFPEAGDFLDSDYKIMRAEPRPEEGRVSVHLARDGSVQEGDVVRLVRVAKRFEFPRGEAGVDLSYEISNRSPDTVESRFAVEINLNLDSNREGSGFLALGDRTVALTKPARLEDVSRIRWGDLRRGLQLRLLLGMPAEVWHYPVETLSDGLEGPQLLYQGLCLVIVWPLRLWGLERCVFDLQLRAGEAYGDGEGAAAFPGFSLSPEL